MTSREIIADGMNIFAGNPDLLTMQNLCNLRMAARLKWEQEEMGGIEHVQFAYRNGTPIVPPGDCGHPLELVRRGFVNGVGWPKELRQPKIALFKWPDGNHWYATVDGIDVTDGGAVKWNTQQEAISAANSFIQRKPL